MKNIWISYLLAILGLLTPISGLHRFYLDKKISGIIYLCTYGLFGIGTIIDLLRMPFLVDRCNLKILLKTHELKLLDPQKDILKIAQKNNGVVTVAMVSLDSNLSLAESKNYLEKMHKEGFCKKDIDEDGVEIFIFLGLKAKKPLF